MTRMNWEAANRRGARDTRRDDGVIEVEANDWFWEEWRADKEAMKADGYFVRKVDGRWRAFRRQW